MLLGWPDLSLTSLSFLYVFLPLSLVPYLLIPAGWRPAALLLISAGYLLLAQPMILLPLTLSILVDYLALRWAGRRDGDDATRRWALLLSGAKTAALLVVVGVVLQQNQAVLLLGTVVYTLSGTAAVASAVRGDLPPGTKLLHFALYCAFYPRLYAGPVQPVRPFLQQLEHLQLHPGGFSIGFGQLVQGGVKLVMLGGGLTQIHTAVAAFPESGRTVLSAWTGLLALTFAVYFTLSGLADMATGIGAMYGIFLPKNYYYPYQSRGVRDFFERFNMTGTALLRRTFPLLDSPGKKGFAAAVSWLLFGAAAGLWFSLRFNFLLWGLILALFALLEQCASGIYDKTPTIITRLWGFGAVLVAFAFLAGETPAAAVSQLRAMLSFSTLPLFNNRILYTITSNWLLLLLSVLLCTNAVNLVVQRLQRHAPLGSRFFLSGVDAVLLVVLTSSLL